MKYVYLGVKDLRVRHFPGAYLNLDARVLCMKIQLCATQEQTKAYEFSLIGPRERGWMESTQQTL